MNVLKRVSVGAFRRGVQCIINSFRTIMDSDQSSEINLRCIIFHILKRNRLASEHRVWVEFVDDTLYLVTHQRPYLHLIS